jgi:hypothetical protein
VEGEVSGGTSVEGKGSGGTSVEGFLLWPESFRSEAAIRRNKSERKK